MNDHSVLTRAVSIPAPSSDHVRQRVQSQQRTLILSQPPRRGRPRHLSLVHVCLGVLFALFEHLESQYDLWRVLISEPIAGFAPTSKGLFWISRFSKHTSYQIKHEAGS